MVTKRKPNMSNCNNKSIYDDKNNYDTPYNPVRYHHLLDGEEYKNDFSVMELLKSLTNHDFSKRLFKKKCYYCNMPLSKDEKTYSIHGKHSKDNDILCCSLCHNLRLHLWR